MRLVSTLAGAGALAGLLLVLAYGATQPTILAHKQAMLQAAIREVLKEPARFETLYRSGGALSAEPPAGVRREDVERVYLGYDAEGRRVGFAIAAAEPGFQDTIELIFGYDAEARKLIGMKVLASKETPGLGDKIEKDGQFVSGFEGALAPLVGVKGSGDADPHAVDMITGATISSRAVLRIINHAIERWQPLLDGFAKEAGR